MSEIGAIATDQYIRDVQTIQNVSTGRTGDFDNKYAEKLVDALNRNGGNYRVVPPSELAQ